MSKEYIHQYMKDLTTEIHRRYRVATNPLIDRVAELVSRRCEQDALPRQEEARRLRTAVAAANSLQQMEQAAETYQKAWTDLLGPDPALSLGKLAVHPSTTSPESQPENRQALGPTPGSLGLLPAQDESLTPGTAIQGKERRLMAAKGLREAASLLAPLPGMARVGADLQDRAQRLEESRFTVALFGAFSAGKSSLANALMGAHILPSSPNPTTAAINRIVPPTADRPHGYVHVVWKSADQLRKEVDHSLTAIGVTPTGDMAADLAAGAQRSREVASPSAKPHAAFLTAAARGYDDAQKYLGQEDEAGLDQFASLVADEKRSCFVEQIDIHVDCPLTRQGITLVDTPGADSINARHTGAAFDFIKNADAILFVTYYNHAFARADQEFLMQLGRVKDAFALDKMFFLVNAADLATSSDELEQVVTHVRKNLQSCGIRQARIFPISSQTALWGRLAGAGALPEDLVQKLVQRLGLTSDTDLATLGLQSSGITQFEEAFYRFVVTDLSQMAIDAAFSEVRRASDTIAHWLEAAQQDEEVRSRQLAQLQRAEQQAAAALDQLDTGPESHQLEREMDELLYYVRKRVLDRYRDHFVEAFNPSVLRADSPNIKGALDDSLRELLGYVAFDLSQEMRATALRVENAVNQQAARVVEKSDRIVQPLLPDWSSPAYRPIRLPVPNFADGHEQLAPEPFQTLLGLFRNPEHFFAQGGREVLRDRLGKALEKPVSHYLQGAKAVLTNWYGGAFSQRVELLRRELAAEVRDHVNGLTAALTIPGESGKLESTLHSLQRIDA